jgi:hypothetical protein
MPDTSPLILHADNGSPMKGATMKVTMERLGVIRLLQPAAGVQRQSLLGGPVPDLQVRPELARLIGFTSPGPLAARACARPPRHAAGVPPARRRAHPRPARAAACPLVGAV